MIDKKLQAKFQASKNYCPTQREIADLHDSIYGIIPLFNLLKKEYEVKSPAELKTATQQFAYGLFDRFQTVGYIDSRLYEYQAITSILKDPTIIDREYENLKDKPNTHSIYTANLLRSQRLAIINAIDEVKNLKKIAKDYSITPKSKITDFVIEGENPKMVADFIKFAIVMLQKNSLRDQLILMLERERKANVEFVRDNLTTHLGLLHEFFSAFSLLHYYSDVYTNNSEKFKFSALDYQYKSGSTKKDEIGLNELFSKEYLQTLSLEDLCFVDAFWVNRFAKELSDMSLTFSSINALNLWPEMFNQDNNFDLTDNEIIAAYRKYHFVSKMLKGTCETQQEKVFNDEFKNGVASKQVLAKDYSEYFAQQSRYISKDYQDFFSEHLHCKQDFYYDSCFSASLINLESQIYRRKQTTIEPIIKSMLDNTHCRNWGIIRDEWKDNCFVDSFKAKSNMCLVAFDIEGFNMPFRFHINKDSLINIVKANNLTALIPEYQGGEDFVINNEVVPTNILMPIQKRHKNAIIQNATNDAENKNFWEHIYFLMNGKFPKHLSDATKVGKNQIKYARKPIHYTSLNTGKQYIKNGNTFSELRELDEER